MQTPTSSVTTKARRKGRGQLESLRSKGWKLGSTASAPSEWPRVEAVPHSRRTMWFRSYPVHCGTSFSRRSIAIIVAVAVPISRTLAVELGQYCAQYMNAHRKQPIERVTGLRRSGHTGFNDKDDPLGGTCDKGRVGKPEDRRAVENYMI